MALTSQPGTGDYSRGLNPTRGPVPTNIRQPAAQQQSQQPAAQASPIPDNIARTAGTKYVVTYTDQAGKTHYVPTNDPNYRPTGVVQQTTSNQNMGVMTGSPYRTSVAFLATNGQPAEVQQANAAINGQPPAPQTVVVQNPNQPVPQPAPMTTRDRLRNVADTLSIIGGYIAPTTMKEQGEAAIIGPAYPIVKLVRKTARGEGFQGIPVSEQYKGTIVEKGANLLTSPLGFVGVPAAAAAGIVYGPTVIAGAKTGISALPAVQTVSRLAARTPVVNALSGIQQAASKNLLLSIGLGAVEGAVIIKGAQSIGTATAPSTERSVIRSQDFKAAQQELNKARQEEISKRPALVQGIYWIPGMARLTDARGNEVGIKAGTDYLVSKGYDRATAESALKRIDTASQYGEIISQLNTGRISERLGETGVASALTGLRTPVKGSVIEVGKRVIGPLAKAGVMEGSVQTYLAGESRYTSQSFLTEKSGSVIDFLNPFTTEDIGRGPQIAKGAVFGAASAALLGVPVIAYAARGPKVSKFFEILGYTTDPTEFPSDQLFNAEKAASRALGRPFAAPVYTAKGGVVEFGTSRGRPIKVKVNVATPANTVSVGTSVPSPANVPNINIPSFIYVPTNVNVPSNVNVPANVNVPVNTPVDVPTTVNVPADVNVPSDINVPVNTPVDVLTNINVPVTTPIFKIPPPLFPPLGGGGSGPGAGGGGGKGPVRYLDEVALAQQFFLAAAGFNPGKPIKARSVARPKLPKRAPSPMEQLFKNLPRRVKEKVKSSKASSANNERPATQVGNRFTRMMFG